MIASWMFIIVTGSACFGASRLKLRSGSGAFPQVTLGPMRNGQPVIHTSVNLANLQMQAPAPGGTVELFNVSGFAARTGWWTANCPHWVSDQMFPPIKVEMGIEIILRKWAEQFTWTLPEDKAGAVVSTNAPVSNDEGADTIPNIASLPKRLPPPPEIPKFREDEKALVLNRMQWFASRSVMFQSNKLEMVGLIPKNFEISLSENIASAVDAPLLAFAIFTREQLEDDRRGSLRKAIEGQIPWARLWARLWYGLGKGLGKKRQLDVFAIQGLVDAPALGPQERSARVLLSKIAEYADKEQRIVVVSKQAYISRDGTDLTEYYVRLGFEKVVRAEGLHELVFWGTSPSAEDMWVESQQTLVGVNF